MSEIDEAVKRILHNVEETPEGLTQFLDNIVEARLLVYLESKPNKTSEGLHKAKTSLDLMKVWLASENYQAFARELTRLAALLPTLMRKYGGEDARNAQLRRRVVGVQLAKLKHLTNAMCKRLLNDTIATTAPPLTGEGQPQ